MTVREQRSWLHRGPVAARALAVVGVYAVTTAAALVGLLHVVPPSAQVDPVHRTISEYALLETGWLFNLAVLGLSAGSVAVLLACVAARLVAASSAAATALLLWGASLATVVIFPKHDWSVGPSISGDIHRIASLVGFLSLPIGALLLARAWREHPRWRAHASLSRLLGSVSLLCFLPIPAAVAVAPLIGTRWWRVIPLGAVERLLALSEVATILALGWWAARAGRSDDGHAAADPPPADQPGDAPLTGTSPRSSECPVETVGGAW